MTSKRFNLLASAASPRRRRTIAQGSAGVSHSIHGPADSTEVIELFDRRYRDVRGEDDPDSSQDPSYPQGRLDQL